ncbi:MAG: hypothetical protein AB1705_27390 [Verrucomicrobiota bacterium]
MSRFAEIHLRASSSPSAGDPNRPSPVAWCAWCDCLVSNLNGRCKRGHPVAINNTLAGAKAGEFLAQLRREAA